MTDLVTFLRDRLAEDLAAAKAVAAKQVWDQMVNGGGEPDPRALREVDAKRAILAEHSPGYPVVYPEPSGQPTCGVCHAGGYDWDPERWPCATVRHLAAVWQDHPDYDPAWKP